jgi:predicted transcriptional regulator YheO
MNLFDLLKEFAGMSREEAEHYFRIENTATEWTMKSVLYLEPTKFHAVLALAKEYGGTYDPKAKGGIIHIPKEVGASNPIPQGHTEPKTTNISTSMPEKVETAEDYALSRSLKGKLGQLVPCLEDASGIVFDGLHRKKIDPNAWTVKIDRIKTPVDRAQARMTVNFCRRHYMSEEMTEDVALQIGSGLTVAQIADATGISERTVYRYMPESLKKPEAKVISEGMKEKVKEQLTAVSYYPKTQETVVQTPTFKRIEKETLNELVECANCHMGFHISRATLIDDKNVCPRCAEHVKPQPKPKGESTLFKPKETGDYRVAQMHPKVSKMDTAMLVRLQNNDEIRKLGWHIEFQKPRTKVICISDVTLIDRFGKEIDVYFDFIETHKNSQVEDDFRREEAARIHKVEVIPLLYDAVTETEERRLEKAIVEQLKSRGSF